MKVGIQILNYNGMKWLPGLLSSLEECSTVNQVVYVVDNASSDESLRYVAREHPDVVIIRHDENLGYGAAYNRSIPRAFEDGCDFVCLQNTDTLLTRGWLDPIAAASKSDPRIGVIGPVFWKWDVDSPNYFMEGRCKDIIPIMTDKDHGPVDRDWIEGSSFFIRKECYEEIGGFDPLYYMYWEDAEYCRRARCNKWRVVIVPGSICRHYAGGSGETGRSYHQIRNHFLYTLTEPTQSFSRNVFSALRLALTYVKQTAWDSPDLMQALRVLRACGSSFASVPCCYRTRTGTAAKSSI